MTDAIFKSLSELPARSVDLSALNLTDLVNGMLGSALKDSRKFFSLLSITSYSSFAFHKFSVVIYNISNLKAVDLAKFPTRYCYCLNNQTNDLSDFTALLVDIIGNSTSYLTEIFKSTSILSVSQTNGSDCVFICVMTGKSGRNLSDFWEVAEKFPVINYTFTSSMSGILATRGTAVTSELTPVSQKTPPRTRISPTAQSPGVSASRTPPWRETAPHSEEVQTMSRDRTPETLTATMAMPGHSPAWFSVLAPKRVTEVLWVTASRQTKASTLPVPLPQTTAEETGGGPPSGRLLSTSESPAEAKEAMATKNLWEPPVRTMAIPGSPLKVSPTSGTFTVGTRTLSPTKAPAPKYPQAGDVQPFSPGEEPVLVSVPHQGSRCPQPLLKFGLMTAAPLSLAIQKLSPCLMELCRFFQQCLCMSQRRTTRLETVRYCLDYYSWFVKNATYVCQRMKRVSHSQTLKQKCLENICKSV
ncbi:HERV-H LTR-associating protein 1 [Erinaceus europaeus]|uniref:HERV-H LTR-associating protein 1 n=1 Tax=Erinaceus europaeus TaxID=9365 RepID=A0ABM3YBB6_ERIEU|nr:HERV-H LTR-associating protein 1 [Erinaceus europaeus]